MNIINYWIVGYLHMPSIMKPKHNDLIRYRPQTPNVYMSTNWIYHCQEYFEETRKVHIVNFLI